MPGLTRKQFAVVAKNAVRANRDPKLRGKARIAKALCALAWSMTPLERAVRHLALVLTHKSYVFLYCARAGMPWRGFMHDWSKFTRVEFFDSVRYFNGRRSPVGLAREVEGRSLAWLHHKGRNTHHFEYWQDAVDESGNLLPNRFEIRPIPMPYPCALEMICDTIAASRAYNGRRFSYDVLAGWWRRRRRRPIGMHDQTIFFCDMIYEEMRLAGSCAPLRRARELFERAQERVRNGEVPAPVDAGDRRASGKE